MSYSPTNLLNNQPVNLPSSNLLNLLRKFLEPTVGIGPTVSALRKHCFTIKLRWHIINCSTLPRLFQAGQAELLRQYLVGWFVSMLAGQGIV